MRLSRSQMCRRAAAAAASLALGVASREAIAADPTATQVVQQMRAALEPDKPSVRQLELTVLGATPAEGSKFQLVQARKRLADKRASLTVLMAPPSAQGIAYLMEDKPGTAPGEYTYVPIVRRVRKLVGAESQSPVLDSDFTFADLGFVPPETQDKIVGEEKVGSHDVYKIESIPSPETQQWYYSKVVTWIDKQSLFPVQRDFYSPAGQVFRIQTFGEVARVDGVPTILETTMETVGAQSRSKLRTTSITYGSDLPDDLFSPAKLPEIVEALEKIGANKAK
jgi:hypothetical protein